VCGHGTSVGDTGENGDSNEAIDPVQVAKSEEIVAKQYLPVYLLAVFSDWVKGPFGYELYSSEEYYNCSPHETYLLCTFVPFLSSIVFGTLVCGPLADNRFGFYRGGRKQMTLVFAFVTAASNITKHFRNFKVLLFGSVLEGISTSLLFTVFDSWLVGCLRNNATTTATTQTPSSTPLLLPRAFATAEYRNNIVAIGAGSIATLVAGATDFRPLLGRATTRLSETADGGDVDDAALLYTGGVLNPFGVSSFALLLCAVSIHVLWGENNGGGGGDTSGGAEKRDDRRLGKTSASASETSAMAAALAVTPSPYGWEGYCSSLSEAFATTLDSGPTVWTTGLVCALFESAMFVFVFTWSSVVASRTGDGDEETVPYDLVFATFMLGCMTGTCVFAVLIDETSTTGQAIGEGVMLAATCTFVGMVVAKSVVSTMLAYFFFEVLVGIYFPLMLTMKAEILPEGHRTTISNIYRLPFNLAMIAFLSLQGVLSPYLSLYPELPFAICACMVGTAFFFLVKLRKHQEEEPRKLHRVSKQQPGKNGSDQALQQKKTL